MKTLVLFLNFIVACLLFSPAGPAAAQTAQALAAESSYEGIDFVKDAALGFSIDGPDGLKISVRVYRQRETPGQYWLLANPVPIKPAERLKGYPSLVFDALPPGEPRPGGGDAAVTHRVTLRFAFRADQ